jgi:SAM-dependent methyltransferase
MLFSAGADSYDAFMGRYSRLLAPLMADFAGVAIGQTVLDVGCGPGALTHELVARVGPASVTAVDPQAHFVAAAAASNPGVKVVQASAEQLPFGDSAFDVTLAQLVVHFMRDPVLGLREMARVTRVGGVVAASVWDFAGGNAPLSLFWRAVLDLDPAGVDEAKLPGARQGDLAKLLAAAGMLDADEQALSATIAHASFEEWWAPYDYGVGPAGAYVARLSAEQRERLRQRCRQMLPDGAFELTFQAWAARGRVATKASA